MCLNFQWQQLQAGSSRSFASTFLGYFVRVPPCPLHPRFFLIFGFFSSVGKRQIQPWGLKLRLVFCQGATTPALEKSKFFCCPCKGDSYSPQGRPKLGVEKSTTKKGPSKCAQGSVAHFEASNFGSYVGQYMTMTAVQVTASYMYELVIVSWAWGGVAGRLLVGWSCIFHPYFEGQCRSGRCSHRQPRLDMS